MPNECFALLAPKPSRCYGNYTSTRSPDPKQNTHSLALVSISIATSPHGELIHYRLRSPSTAIAELPWRSKREEKHPATSAFCLLHERPVCSQPSNSNLIANPLATRALASSCLVRARKGRSLHVWLTTLRCIVVTLADRLLLAASMDHHRAGARNGADVDGGEAEAGYLYTKGGVVAETEELLSEASSPVQQPRFLLSSSEKRGAWYERFSKKALFIGQVLLLGVVVVQSVMLYRSYALAAALAADLAEAGVMRKGASAEGSSSVASNLPDYLVTKPMLLPGKCFRFMEIQESKTN